MADYRPPVAHPKGLEPAASMVSTRAPDLDTPAETPAPVAQKKAPKRLPAGMPSPNRLGVTASPEPATNVEGQGEAPPTDWPLEDDSANEAPVTDAPASA